MENKFSPAFTPCAEAQGLATTALRREESSTPAEVPERSGLDEATNEAKLALTATFAAEPLAETLQFWQRELRLRLDISFAPYGQIFQQLLDPGSLLASNRRGLNVLLIRWEDLARADTEPGPSTLPEGGVQLERHAAELLATVSHAVAQSSVAWLVCLCPASRAALAQPAVAELFERLEESWATELAGLSSLHLTRPGELFRYYPVAEYDAPYANQLGHMPYTAAAYAGLATLVMRKAHALWQPVRKVIALDCDQTLWQGVCGEDGAAGIQLDAPRLALQRFMRRQQENGLLLCLCSKNNETDVAEVFQTRPEMILRPEHFAAQRINWQPKSENLHSLAEELGLSLGSFIFVDDNPLECAEVEAHCPGVLSLTLPEDPSVWGAFLEHIWAFDPWKVTAEDRQRTALYHQHRLRRQVESTCGSLADFLAGLKLEVRVEPARVEQLARVAELTQRTNQFNCTTHRRTEAEMAEIYRSPDWTVLTVQVRDRFGDYGLVGVILYRCSGEALEVETFLLSCRALGKGVEHRMLAVLGQLAGQMGLEWVAVRYRPSGKNQPALNFLNQEGAVYQPAGELESVFRFPARAAAAMRFAPEKASAALPTGASGTKRPGPAPEEGQVLGMVRYSWIAEQAREPGQILRQLTREALSLEGPERKLMPPHTAVEQQLCRLWQQVLRREQVGIEDDFFELGGTSQLAVRLLAGWEQLTGQKVALVTLFKAPTIERLARHLEAAREQFTTP